MRQFLAGVLVTTSLALLGFQSEKLDQKEDPNQKTDSVPQYTYTIQMIGWAAPQRMTVATSKTQQKLEDLRAEVLSRSINESAQAYGARLAHVYRDGDFLTYIWEKHE